MHVFIYGTLKRGFPLHQMGLKSAPFQGDVVTSVPYPLFIAGTFYGPMMLDQPGQGLHVRGELFDVSEECLLKLDELEDIGQTGSFRGTVPVTGFVDGEITAICYFKTDTWLNPLHSACLDDYRDRRFIPPWEREN